MIVALVFFVLSLLGIVLLFAHKAWELRTSKVALPQLRERADSSAHEMKRLILWSQEELKKLPPEIAYISRTILHDAALGAASVARFLESQSHRLADMVSHKRTFERRETNSDFLKNVSEYKNGGGESDSSSATENRSQ